MCLPCLENFNPRSHERSDPSFKFYVCFDVISIHAPTRGATAAVLSEDSHIMYFNPRSHERSDVCYIHRRKGHDISIHAPTRGATDNSKDSSHGSRFQSTLPREERQISEKGGKTGRYFNPRSHERSDDNATG